jgi:solute carrier family 25 carnitine/acylcarnitine transporter 20/29
MMKAEGPLALYKGMSAPLAGVTPMYALCFFGYGVGQKIFCNENSFADLDLVRIGLAGATSGIFTTPILAPGERAKCVLQVQGPGGPHKGPVDVWKALYKQGGLASVNRGFSATLARDSLASFFYFSSYEYLKRKFTPEGHKGPSVVGTLVAGGCAGILNWLPALPIDTLKSKLQVAPEGTYPHGIRSVFREVMAKEGFFSLYKGFSAVMLRAFPANAACFLGYETAIKLMNSVRLLDGL